MVFVGADTPASNNHIYGIILTTSLIGKTHFSYISIAACLPDDANNGHAMLSYTNRKHRATYTIHPNSRSNFDYLKGKLFLGSMLYLSHSPTALKLSHLTLSSASCMSSITLALRPSFSSCWRFSGTSLTKLATSLQPMAKTCLSFSQLLERISASFLGSSPLFSSRIRRALSRQKVGLRWGGDQRRWPERTSAAYSSKVV